MVGDSSKMQVELALLSGNQDAERAKDAAWMWSGGLIFLPVMAKAATGEDYASQIGKLKSEAEALNTALISKRRI